MKVFLVALMIAATTPIAAGAQSVMPEGAGAFERGRTLSGWLRDGEYDALIAVMSRELKAVVGGREGLAEFAAKIKTESGAEVEVLRESAFREGGQISYYRVCRFENAPSLTTSWIWDSEGVVTGLLVQPTPRPAESDRLDYVTKAPLRLPFDDPEEGSWYVNWGGRETVDNYHVIAPDQRFAYDFTVVHGGRFHDGDGTHNEDYHAWGRPIHAPAVGRVVKVVNSVDDNVPGRMNPASPPGNYVVIDHGSGEYSLLAHFRKGTVAVREGETVDPGTFLGECGNSGNSSMPHLHYHLQTGVRFGAGRGLPAAFRDYFVGGKYVEIGEPVRGELIAPDGTP